MKTLLQIFKNEIFFSHEKKFIGEETKEPFQMGSSCCSKRIRSEKKDFVCNKYLL